MSRNRQARNRKPPVLPKNFLEALGSVEAVDRFILAAKPGYEYNIVTLPCAHDEEDHEINIGDGHYQVIGRPYLIRWETVSFRGRKLRFPHGR